MDITTISELINWMDENCYRVDAYAIGGRKIYEGFGIGRKDTGFTWYFSERGFQEVIMEFETEAEVVAHAFKRISKDLSAKSHCIGFLKSTTELKSLTEELQNRNISFDQDEIPYENMDDIRHRVFVYGCDIKSTLDLQKKYYQKD